MTLLNGVCSMGRVDFVVYLIPNLCGYVMYVHICIVVVFHDFSFDKKQLIWSNLIFK